MIFILFPISLVGGVYYSESELSLLCTKGKADSNPPTLYPGQSTINKINGLKRKNYLEHYYNQNDHEFTNDEKLEYADDLMPYAFFLFLSLFGIILWFMYSSCIICKCCYCVAGPATEIQSKGRKIIPILLLGIFFVGILTFGPIGIFYVSQLQGTLSYLVCVTARWSGGYFYGYSGWQGIININNSTSSLLDFISNTTDQLDRDLNNFKDGGVKNITEELKEFMNSFIKNWVDHKDKDNNFSSNYSEEIPISYQCQLCKDIANYQENFTSDLDVLIKPISENTTLAIAQIYEDLIDKQKELLYNFTIKYAWTKNFTDLYNNYEIKNLPFFSNLNSMQDSMYSNTLSFLGISILVMLFQAFSVNMVLRHKMNWRKWLHIGWCCHSFLMIFFFLIAGILFIFSIVMTESCEIFVDIRDSHGLQNVFDSDGRSALEYCYYSSDGDLASFLNISSDFEFLSPLISSIQTILDHNYTENYTIPTFENLNFLLKSSDTSVFHSTKNDNIHWQGASEVNFYLFQKDKKISYTQLNYLNNFTILNTDTAQENYCKTTISKDFWSFSKSYCQNGYSFTYTLSPISTPNVSACYVMMQNYSKQEVEKRYVDLKLFENCDPVPLGNGETLNFSLAIMAYWSWANNAFELDDYFNKTLYNLITNFNDNYDKVTEKIVLLSNYTSVLSSTNTYLQDIKDRLDIIYLAMNCTMIYDLTSQLYLGLCGQILENLFFLSIYSGALALCNMLFSLGLVLFIFRFRSDLEIEQEKIMRTIGGNWTLGKTESVSSRVDDTIINKD
ncbi:hypothetical protein SteCoe_15502 [Stentor coeruleus]|uniref:Uncharacterized protein n=1 Tax=Stentor coeruleus TaxID=5963 RepID=A0A1R2C3D3_9CILI|nr:hypothetical protein SteCoe_15502 [Stentor coeruleus]